MRGLGQNKKKNRIGLRVTKTKTAGCDGLGDLRFWHGWIEGKPRGRPTRQNQHEALLVPGSWVRQSRGIIAAMFSPPAQHAHARPSYKLRSNPRRESPGVGPWPWLAAPHGEQRDAPPRSTPAGACTPRARALSNPAAVAAAAVDDDNSLVSDLLLPQVRIQLVSNI